MMIKRLFLIFLCITSLTVASYGQVQRARATNSASRGSASAASKLRDTGKSSSRDSLSTKNKEIPKGVKVWSVDKRFGDIRMQPMDTLTHMFQNSVFTSGRYGEYNTLGNIGGPRINRIFTDRKSDDADFLFTSPYDFSTTTNEDFLFTNTRSPYANLSYDFCGNRVTGEDHFVARYAVNAGKRLGFGFHINYLYGRGYYTDQNTSLLNGNIYGSYLGDAYQAHFLYRGNWQKMSENGGITNDMYITHPESFDDNYATTEIPANLYYNWNRNRHQHLFFTQRYSLGFHRKVKMTEEEIEAKKFAMEAMKQEAERLAKEKAKRNGDDDEDDDSYRSNRKRNNSEPAFTGRPKGATIAKEPAPADSTAVDSLGNGRTSLSLAAADSIINAEKQTAEEVGDTAWMKREFVPVTSFIHTAQFDSHDRIYQAYASPTDYYANDYYGEDVIGGDSIYDKTKFYRLRNTLALSLLEGFNKWMVAGLKVFAASDLRHYALPDEQGLLTSYNTHNLSIGGQMSRAQGKLLHYNVQAETWLLGDDQAQVKIDGNADLNFRLFGDTVTLAAKAFFHNERPNYYLRHFHGRHFWWDDDLSMSTHTHLEGLFSYQKTRTTLRIAADELTNYTYLAETHDTPDDDTRNMYNVTVNQSGDAITMLTAALNQKFTFGPVNWESILTYQKSTNQAVLPVPTFNIYSNLYLKFYIAKVLYTELGGDVRYFTEYEAPSYVPGIGQFAVQANEEKVKIGNYPIINLYANFNLKGTRFFVMYTHATNGSFNANSFLTPHYPINPTILRIGISWNFYN